MNILIITAHPSSAGFSHRIAQSYADGAKNSHTVEILDLYKTELKQDFLCFENIKELETDTIKKTLQQKISWADELVFVHPLWWGGAPAIMKNFIDQNFTAGFAYKYISRPHIPKALNLLPEGLLKGKKARVFITFDAPFLVYLFMVLPFVTIWNVFIFSFCGIKIGSIRLYDRMRYRSEVHKLKWLEKVYEMGKNA
jgi:NAD(P)H dehydrogenase (quinone)